MELDQFIKETIVHILTGIKGAESAGIKASSPSQEIEFDLGINIQSEKIEVVGMHGGGLPATSRIRFSIPIPEDGYSKEFLDIFKKSQARR